MKEWMTAAEIANVLEVSRRTVERWANRGGWLCRPRSGRGSEYNVNNHPTTQAAWARSVAAEAARAASRGGAEKDAAIACSRDPARLNRMNAGAADRADARVRILAAFAAYHEASGLALHRARRRFADDYNSGADVAGDGVRDFVATVSAGSLQRWASALKDDGAAALAGRYGNRKGAGKIDQRADLRDLIVGLITNHPHASAKVIMRAIRARFPAEERPAYRSLQRWVAKWREDNAQALLAVRDPDAWRSRYRASAGTAGQNITRINQVWEMDSTPADVMLDGGRHCLIGVIDIYSRRAKLLVSPTSRATAVAALLRRAMIDWGVPETVATDNGTDYVSRHVTRVLADLDIRHKVCPPFTPEAKPFIERFFGTFSRDLLELLPGFIGHNVADRQAIENRRSFAQRFGKADEVIEVAMTAEDFQAFCDRWCDDLYGREGHRSLGGKSPFETAAARADQVKRVDERGLDILLAEAPAGGWRTVQKSGIAVEGATFIHAELGEHVGRKVGVRFDPADLGRIYVFDTEGEFICAAECPERTGINRQVVAARKREKQKAHIAAQRAELKRTARDAGIDTIVAEILDGAAEEAGQVVAFPRPAEEHETPALAAAAEAAAAGDRPAINQLTTEQQAAADRLWESMEGDGEPAQTAEVTVLHAADSRPRFESDEDFARYLIGHPEEMDDHDRKWLDDKLASKSFRLLIGVEDEKMAAAEVARG